MFDMIGIHFPNNLALYHIKSFCQTCNQKLILPRSWGSYVERDSKVEFSPLLTWSIILLSILNIIGTPGKNRHQSLSASGSGEFSESIFTYSEVELKFDLHIVLVYYFFSWKNSFATNSVNHHRFWFQLIEGEVLFCLLNVFWLPSF